MMVEDGSKIIFFSQGHILCREFTFENDRPNFFWYCDKFFSHFSIKRQDRYLHIFVVNFNDISSDTIFMQGNKSWEDVYSFFREFDNNHVGNNVSPNPPILRINKTLVPDLVFDFEEVGNENAKLILPEYNGEVSVKFFDENHFPIKFRSIPDLVEVFKKVCNVDITK